MEAERPDEPTLVGPDALPEIGSRGMRNFRAYKYTARLMFGMRSNPLELWLLVGMNVIIFALIAYVVLS
ncbi:MAG TPA: hypothetical protein VIP09_14590 [Dehalococcoidia bacterium]|jgi:hypothetical protein